MPEQVDGSVTGIDEGWAVYTTPAIAGTGFRDYDARWLFPDEINLSGVKAVGRGIGNLMHHKGIDPIIVIGHDFREYSESVKNALIVGLLEVGIGVLDIGLALSPMAYYSRLHLGVPSVAMITASHNPNGWTGVKLGFVHPLTCGSRDMQALREKTFEPHESRRTGGFYQEVTGVREAYLSDLANEGLVQRRLKVVCATASGTASAFAPELLSRIGLSVIPLHTDPDYAFPHYNPNPESVEMLKDMARAVVEHHADLAFGFDGDGDRLGVVHNQGEAVSADKMGLLMARHMAKSNPMARFAADVKSTALFATDPLLNELGAIVEYCRTGHSHMKKRLLETGALAGFEKAGHFYFSEPIGHGYDCALQAAVMVCRLLDTHPALSLSELYEQLPKTWISPTMSPYCPDDRKHSVMEILSRALHRIADDGGHMAGRKIVELVEVDGVRLVLADGSWALVRVSSNMPNLVVVCESLRSADDMRRIFVEFDAILRDTVRIGPYDQSIEVDADCRAG